MSSILGKKQKKMGAEKEENDFKGYLNTPQNTPIQYILRVSFVSDKNDR